MSYTETLLNRPRQIQGMRSFNMHLDLKGTRHLYLKHAVPVRPHYDRARYERLSGTRTTLVSM